jgi:hypothetical protein
MARVDVPHWLSLKLERLYLQEFIEDRRDEDSRTALRDLAQTYEATAIVRLTA